MERKHKNSSKAAVSSAISSGHTSWLITDKWFLSLPQRQTWRKDLKWKWGFFRVVSAQKWECEKMTLCKKCNRQS